MIWYEVPVISAMILWVILLMILVLQAVVVLEAGEMLREKRTLAYIRLLYGFLGGIAAVLFLETLLAIASIEGGLFVRISMLPRYVAVLPALLFLFGLKLNLQVPLPLRPPTLTFFIPLLMLPPIERLPWPLPFLLLVLTVAWLGADAVRMLLSFRDYARMEITRSVIPHIIRKIDHGICVTDHRGWILEANPAFYCLCRSIGIHETERIHEFEQNLEALSASGHLAISNTENGRLIYRDQGVYLLQRNTFKFSYKRFMQLALSDVTDITRVSAELERENEKLIQENCNLEGILSTIEMEAIAHEREKLSSAAHDLWSQRLAVAGFLLDAMFEQKPARSNGADLEDIARILEVPTEELGPTNACLSEVLPALTEMYCQLGVKIKITGQADFTRNEQEAVCAVLREALANAVRHAYAPRILVRFHQDSDKKGVTILNDCLDDKPGIVEGRGLYDMKTRVHHAGGAFHYRKSNLFELQVTFQKGFMNQEEDVAL